MGFAWEKFTGSMPHRQGGSCGVGAISRREIARAGGAGAGPPGVELCLKSVHSLVEDARQEIAEGIDFGDAETPAVGADHQIHPGGGTACVYLRLLPSESISWIAVMVSNHIPLSHPCQSVQSVVKHADPGREPPTPNRMLSGKKRHRPGTSRSPDRYWTQKFGTQEFGTQEFGTQE